MKLRWNQWNKHSRKWVISNLLSSIQPEMQRRQTWAFLKEDKRHPISDFICWIAMFEWNYLNGFPEGILNMYVRFGWPKLWLTGILIHSIEVFLSKSWYSETKFHTAESGKLTCLHSNPFQFESKIELILMNLQEYSWYIKRNFQHIKRHNTCPFPL